MKTPRRDYKAPYAPQRQDIVDCTLESWKRCKDTRWKRKNRIKQLKRTIARLTKELAAARESCDYLYTAYIENERCTRALYEYIMRERKKRPETDESGQQTDLPTKCGQQDSIAQNARKAKQEGLTCADAEQLTARKEQR